MGWQDIRILSQSNTLLYRKRESYILQ